MRKKRRKNPRGDARIRDLERRARAGDLDAQAALVTAQLRTGVITPPSHQLAAAGAPIRCPGCNQEVTYDLRQDFTECGGSGNGICAEASYAYDVRDGRPPEWEWLWDDDEMPDPGPPSRATQRAILAAHDAVYARAERERPRCMAERRDFDRGRWVDVGCESPVAGTDPWSGTPLCDEHLAPLLAEWNHHNTQRSRELGARFVAPSSVRRARPGDRQRPPRLNPPAGDERLRALAREAQHDPSAQEALIVELGRRGRLWVALVTGDYQKVKARLFDAETQRPRGRGATFLREYTGFTQPGADRPSALDLQSMGPRSALRQLLEELRARYGARCRYLELREETERELPAGQPMPEEWASWARTVAKERRKEGVIGWNPPGSGDERRRVLERAAAQGDPAAIEALRAHEERVRPRRWLEDFPVVGTNSLWRGQWKPSWGGHPHAGGVDEHAENELVIYVDNERDLHDWQTKVGEHLIEKYLKGKYDPMKAWKAWLTIVEAGAARYVREFSAGPVQDTFNRATRIAAAMALAMRFEEQCRFGEERWETVAEAVSARLPKRRKR